MGGARREIRGREMRTIKVLVPGAEEGHWIDFMSNDPTLEYICLIVSVAPNVTIRVRLVDMESALRAMKC